MFSVDLIIISSLTMFFFFSLKEARGLSYIQFQRHVEKKFLQENVESYEIIKLMSSGHP